MKPGEKNVIKKMPEKYRPLGAWKYFWLNVLFSIPLIGFICLIVFSFSGKNINRRSYARSFFCALLIGVIIVAALIIVAVVTVGAGELMDTVKEYWNQILDMFKGATGK